eukprot:GHVT01025347.1.p1 GENE.GHVT01025347.1~~GHVT01025347.1.p1  ORF type:complete len:551 (+),score=39.03 GHVT01025347.1:980-2632(+)
MHVAVMGLGNTQYVYFNEMAKRTERNLVRLGAATICSRGDGDDDQDIEEDFSIWKEILMPALEAARTAASTGDGVSGKKARRAECLGDVTPQALKNNKKAQLDIRFVHGEAAQAAVPEEIHPSTVVSHMYFSRIQCRVTAAHELRQRADPSRGLTTFQVDLTTESNVSTLKYETADDLYVLPRNELNVVEWWANRLRLRERGISLDDSFTFIPRLETKDNMKRPFPTPCTVRHALTYYCDLSSLPHRAPLRDLSCFIRDEEERRRVDMLLSAAGSSDFQVHVKAPFFSLGQFVSIFMNSAEFDLGLFFQLVPRQRARPYTIASSPRAQPKVISLVCSQVYEELPSLHPHFESLRTKGYVIMPSLPASFPQRSCFRGLCSFQLTGCSSGDVLEVRVMRSTLQLPSDTSKPILMIAAGAGFAPFRGFLQEFASMGGWGGTTVLVFGCCHKEEDWIFRQDMERAAAPPKPCLDRLICAFSRDQTPKIYVQDRLLEHADFVWELLQAGAFVFVCGSMAMGHGTARALEQILETRGVSDYLTTMRKDGRLHEELW